MLKRSIARVGRDVYCQCRMKGGQDYNKTMFKWSTWFGLLAGQTEHPKSDYPAASAQASDHETKTNMSLIPRISNGG
jgi:hypothetical protein